MVKQNWTLTYAPSKSIRLILHGCTLPLCRKHLQDCRSPLACCHWHSVPHYTQYQKVSLNICPELAGAAPYLSFLQGSFTTASFIQFSNIKKRCPGPENPSAEAGIPCDYTSLWHRHDRQGEETCSLIFSWLVQIPWRPKLNLLIKHCKTNASSHRSTCAWNNQRVVFQKPKPEKCLLSSLCRPAYSDPPEERDLWPQ